MTERPLNDDDQPATRGMLKQLKVELKTELKTELTTELSAVFETRLKESGEQTRRHFDVVAEGLRDDIRRLADGVAANTVAIQQLGAQFESSKDRSALLELRVDDHERRIRRLESQ